MNKLTNEEQEFLKNSHLTSDQELATSTTGNNIIVSAGAGSGKTFVLTQRISFFLKYRQYKLNEFLIVTFTNLAANEMKNRIRKAVSKLIDSDSSFECDENNVDTADICTFDAFSLNLVKKYHYRLGLPASVKLIEETIISVKVKNLINEYLEEGYKNNKLLQQLAEETCIKDDYKISGLLFDMYNYFAKKLHSDEELETYTDRVFDEKFIEENVVGFYLEELNKLRRKLLDAYSNLHTSSIHGKINDFKNLLKTVLVDSGFACGDTIDDYDTFMSFDISGIEFPKSNTSSYECFASEIEEIKVSYKEDEKGILKLMNHLPKTKAEFINDIMSNKKYCEMLIEYVKQIRAEIEAFKKKYSAYTFDDIARFALKLVQENEDIRESLKKKYKMIMIDEYQDTSEIQDTFMALISNKNLYMVGDIKQSIYGFRNARCDLFQNKFDEYTDIKEIIAKDIDVNTIKGIAIKMNINFRSRSIILNDINHIFIKLMVPTFGDSHIDYNKDHIIETLDTYAQNNLEDNINVNNTEFLIVPNGKFSDETADNEVYAIAHDIIDKIKNGTLVTYEDDNRKKHPRKCDYSDFCILVDRKTMFDRYITVFEELGIPLYVELDADISNDNFIYFFKNLVKFVSFTLKNMNEEYVNSVDYYHSFMSLARSTLIKKYTDEELHNIVKEDKLYHTDIYKNIKSYLKDVGGLTPYEIINHVVNKLELYKKLVVLGNVKKYSEYLDAILNYFKEMSSYDYDLEDFITFLENVDEYELPIKITPKGTSQPCVKLMNFHKSKGLEFPFIYYPHLDKKLNNPINQSNSGICDYGMYIKRLPEIPGVIEDEKAILYIKDIYSKKSTLVKIEENIRLFYVALTRAKEKMTFVISDDVSAVPDNKKDLTALQSVCKLIKDLDTKDNDKIEDIIKTSSLKDELKDFLRYMFNLKDTFTSTTGTVNKAYYNFLAWNILPNGGILNRYLESYFIDGSSRSGTYAKLIKTFVNALGYDIDQELMGIFADDKIKTAKDINFYFDKHIKLIDLEKAYKYDDKFVECLVETFEVNKNTKSGPSGFLENSFTLNSATYSPTIDFVNKVIILLYKTKDLSYKSLLEKFNITVAELPEEDISEKDLSNIKFNLFTGWFFDNCCHVDFLALYNLANPYEILVDWYLSNLSISKDQLKAIFDFIGMHFEDVTFESKLYSRSITLKEYKKETSSMIPASDIAFEKCLSMQDLIDYFYKCGYFKKYNGNISRTPDDIDEENETVVNKHILDNIPLFPWGGAVDLWNKILEYGLKDDFEDYIRNAYPSEYSNFDSNDELQKTNMAIKINDILWHKPNTFLELHDIVHVSKLSKTTSLGLSSNLFENEDEEKRASKSLTLGVDTHALEYGTKLHEYMELLDFRNPDLSYVKEDVANVTRVINKFLSWDIIKALKTNTGKVYKEYEFYDEDAHINGIIDLMIVYDDHIDIIDYKTSNIDDEKYVTQVGIYKDFISKQFNKTVHTYLYSLLQGKYKQID